MDTIDRLIHETTELLQQLIRNECVNDGTRESGGETRNADVLTSVLEGAGLEVTTLTDVEGRANVVARIDGSDPDAPTVMLMGHTDVVPAVAEDWREDPFGGELIDGEVWGRGALDMLGHTASMAVAMRHLADSGWTPRGSLVFLGVADEEAGGVHGAKWLVEDHWDEVACDYVLTESGGFVLDAPGGRRVVLHTAEKGLGEQRLTIRGTPGHGSMPWNSDNAVVTAAEVVRRISAHATTPHLDDAWRGLVRSFGLPADEEQALLDPGRVRDALAALPPAMRPFAHACTHMTMSPNTVHGGQKSNTIADEVVIELDVRTLPGQTGEDVHAELRAALGDELYARVEVEPVHNRVASTSPTDTPVYEHVQRHLLDLYPGAEVLPMLLVAVTDAAFFRARGVPSYGVGAFSERAPFGEIFSRFHGRDERIDVESLRLTTELWLDVADGVVA